MGLYDEVQTYLIDNYERDGNDVLVECHERAEIEAWMGKAKTLKGALRNIYRESGVKTYASYRADIQAEADY